MIRTETLTALLEHADTLCLSAIELVQGVMDRLVDDALAIPVILTNKVSPYGSDADAAVVLDTAPSSVDVVGSARRDETETAASAPRFADYFEASFKSNGFGSGVEEAWTTGTVSCAYALQPIAPLNISYELELSLNSIYYHKHNVFFCVFFIHPLPLLPTIFYPFPCLSRYIYIHIYIYMYIYKFGFPFNLIYLFVIYCNHSLTPETSPSLLLLLHG